MSEIRREGGGEGRQEGGREEVWGGGRQGEYMMETGMTNVKTYMLKKVEK